jgi:zinc protease
MALALLVSVPAYARDMAPKNGVSTFDLDNGMQVVVIPDHRAPIVTHMVWYKIGSADEPPGKSGIAHFFEHLMFKGTATHPAGDFDSTVASIGGSSNAFTSYDFTAFHETVAPEALGSMMKLEADRMRNLTLTDAVIGPERDVVLEERQSNVEADPDSVLSEEIRATLYQNHPYRIPIIGWRHEIEKLNRTDATAFYDRYYRPNNAILVVAGDIDPTQVRALAAETYGVVPRGPDLPPRDRPTEPVQDASRTVTLADARISLPSTVRQWVVPSYRTAEPGEAEALELLAEILGGGTRSRLYQAFVVKSSDAASVGANYSGTMLDDTTFSVYASPRVPEGLKPLEDGVYAQIARIVRDGVTEDELARAKTRFVRSAIFARDSAGGMANIYGETLATGNTIADIDEWPDRIEKVTADQVKAVATKYLRPEIAVTGYLLPKDGEAK